MAIATTTELESFLERYPQTRTLEVLMPDINGILRCKRIDRCEFHTLFKGGLKCPISTPLLDCMSELPEGLDSATFAGDPDQVLLPISGTLAPVPWLNSPTAQVLVGLADLDGAPAWIDPRNVLQRVLHRYQADKLRPVVATELEFYLVKMGDGKTPERVLCHVPGTAIPQTGIQYCIAEDLWSADGFLEDIRLACDVQSIPLSAMHSEFAEGQWEINTLHAEDPLLGCDRTAMFKRLVKGVAQKHGFAACFMAKPFADQAGSGMHIHVSAYDAQGENIFAIGEKHGDRGNETPEFGGTLLSAIGGLARTMPSGMAIFAPNANSYRRLRPDTYAPIAVNWGYNHRGVSLRLPVSSPNNRRIEHRVAGADSNPYLVVAAVLAGIHHGLNSPCALPETVHAGTEPKALGGYLPRRWDYALDAFRACEILPTYLGDNYCRLFAISRQEECDRLHYLIPDTDYKWYLRVV